MLAILKFDGIARIGPHKHAVVYAMHRESLVNLVLECPEPKDPSEWDESTYVEEIQAIFQGWDARLMPPNLPLRFIVSLLTSETV